MSAHGTILLYETNRTSESEDDYMATHEMDQLTIEALVVCRIYGEDVKMIAAEKSASRRHSSRRKIYRRIEECDLHYFETPDGETLVCGRSLSRKMDELDSVTHQGQVGGRDH